MLTRHIHVEQMQSQHVGHLKNEHTCVCVYTHGRPARVSAHKLEHMANTSMMPGYYARVSRLVCARLLASVCVCVLQSPRQQGGKCAAHGLVWLACTHTHTHMCSSFECRHAHKRAYVCGIRHKIEARRRRRVCMQSMQMGIVHAHEWELGNC